MNKKLKMIEELIRIDYWGVAYEYWQRYCGILWKVTFL